MFAFLKRDLFMPQLCKTNLTWASKVDSGFSLLTHGIISVGCTPFKIISVFLLLSVSICIEAFLKSPV